MKLKLRTIFLILLPVLAFLPAGFAFAAGCDNNPFPDQAGGLMSQLPLFCSPGQIANWAITVLLGLAASVTILFIILGGYYYMTSAGNEEQSEHGRKMLTNSLIGLAVIIMSFAIVKIAANLLTNGGAGSSTITNNTPPNNPGSNQNLNGGSGSTAQDVIANMYAGGSGPLQVSMAQQTGSVNITASFPSANLAALQSVCGGGNIDFAASLKTNNVTKHATFSPTGKNYYASVTFTASNVTSNTDTVIFAMCGVVFPVDGLPFTMPQQLQNVNGN